MHQENSFITLTYDDNHLISPKLIYSDFQNFMKRLRDRINYEQKIGYFVTGEYGDQKKRPHWHALLFNWRPNDCVYKYSNERGDKIYSSRILSELWRDGISEIGSVTFESAGYVARYAAKKLVHGYDDHDYQPISKKSCVNAIGKSFLEKYYRDIFGSGVVTIQNASGEIIQSSIPRYYEKWFKENHFEEWLCYIKRVKSEKMLKAQQKSDLLQQKYIAENEKRLEDFGFTAGNQTTLKEQETKIQNKRFELLQSLLKGDI